MTTLRNPSHPGEVIKTLLELGELTQTDLAKAIKVRQSKISEIINGKRGITAEMAYKLGRAFGMNPEVWMNLQGNWQLAQIDAKQFSKIHVLDSRKAA